MKPNATCTSPQESYLGTYYTASSGKWELITGQAMNVEKLLRKHALKGEESACYLPHRRHLLLLFCILRE